MKNIPKKLHFIWIGGPMPDRNKACVASFAQNQDWDIWLWIDPHNLLLQQRRKLVKERIEAKATRKALDDQAKAKLAAKTHAEIAKKLGPEGGDQRTIQMLAREFGVSPDDMRQIRHQALFELEAFAAGSGIKIRSADEFSDGLGGVSYSLYSQELVKRNVNFGAASDILRIEILLKYGGLYLDTDVTQLAPLGDLKAGDLPLWAATHVAWGKTLPTKAQWEDDNWWKQKVSGLPVICNSIIGAQPECEALERYRTKIEENFKAMASSREMQRQYVADIRTSTIRMTGPSAAADAVGFNQYKEDAFNRSVRGTTPEQGDLIRHQENLWCRDNIFFPMYLIKDNFFHDWLDKKDASATAAVAH